MSYEETPLSARSLHNCVRGGGDTVLPAALGSGLFRGRAGCGRRRDNDSVLGENGNMKIIVIKPPRFLRPFLRRIFGQRHPKAGT